jgi:hypothetical protein
MEHAKHLVIYWRSKGHKTQTIATKLTTSLGPEAPPYSTVAYWVRMLKLGNNILDVPESPGRPYDVDLDDRIFEALNEFPFHSVRTLASSLKRPRATIHQHLLRAGFELKHLKWVPHTLSEEQKRLRIEYAGELLDMLRAARHNSWNYFVTGDESWFYLETSHETIWLQHGDPRPVREKKVINSPKVMLTVFWSPNGFHLIEALPAGQTFTSDYFSQTILYTLHKNLSHMTARRIVVHMDNARPHRSKVTSGYLTKFNFRPAPHPPYSPDLAPSDFFLFGALKHKLEGMKFANAAQLVDAVMEITGFMPRSELKAVFVNWEERLRKCIEMQGEYVS